MTIKNLFKAVAFFVLFVFCFIPVNKVVSQPEDKRNHQWIAGFYEEPENSLDAVYIGSSNCYAFWNPLIAWESHGITVYPYACNDQPFAATSHLIEEVHKTQPQATIIVNVNSLWETKIKNTDIHYLLDNMPLSRNKLALTKHLCRKADLDFAESLEYYLPIIRYHERWNEVDMRDFDVPLDGLKGASTYHNHINGIQNITDLYRVGETPAEPEEAVEQLLEELLDYCDENRVKNILFVTVPRAEKAAEAPDVFLSLNETIASRGYDVLDMMDMLEETGLELFRDYYNDTHTNIHGSIKFTRYLAEYLVTNYGFRDKRGQEDYSSWDTARKKYAAYMDGCVLDLEYDGSGRDYTLSEPGGLKAQKLEDGVAVTWQSVNGADGYAVYKKTGSGRWKHLDDVVGNDILDTEMKADSTQIYRVIAYRTQEDGRPCYGRFAYNGVSVKT